MAALPNQHRRRIVDRQSVVGIHAHPDVRVVPEDGVEGRFDDGCVAELAERAAQDAHSCAAEIGERHVGEREEGGGVEAREGKHDVEFVRHHLGGVAGVEAGMG